MLRGAVTPWQTPRDTCLLASTGALSEGAGEGPEMAGPAGGSAARQPTDQKTAPRRTGVPSHSGSGNYTLLLTEHDDLIYSVPRGIPL